MTAGEIAQRFSAMMSQPAISKHLSLLENAGLVWREKSGQDVHYGFEEDALSMLVHFPGRDVPAIASLPERQRRGRQAQERAQGRNIAG